MSSTMYGLQKNLNWYSSRGAFQLSKQLLKEAIIHLRPPKKRWWQKSIHTWLSKDGEGSSASSFSSGVSVCACDKRFTFLLPLPPSRPPIKTSSVFNCYRRLHTFYFYFAPSGKNGMKRILMAEINISRGSCAPRRRVDTG